MSRFVTVRILLWPEVRKNIMSSEEMLKDGILTVLYNKGRGNFSQKDSHYLKLVSFYENQTNTYSPYG